MRTPAIMIFIVCVLIIGIALLAVYDYRRRGFRTEEPDITKSEAESLKLTREEGDAEFFKQNYRAAITKYQQALKVWPKDAHLHNDLAAAHYRLGLQLMDPPMDEDEFEFGFEIDARDIEGSRIPEIEKMVESTKSGMITAVINSQADKDEITRRIRILGHYVHVEEEETEDDDREYWLTIITGETKENFLNAENEYRRAIGIKSVKADNGRRYSNYSTASRNLGTLYFRMGRKKEAVTQWRRALQLEPTDAELRELLNKYE